MGTRKRPGWGTRRQSRQMLHRQARRRYLLPGTHSSASMHVFAVGMAVDLIAKLQLRAMRVADCEIRAGRYSTLSF
jgi:ribosomal protein L21E